MIPWTPIAISFGAILGALSRYYITLLWIHKRGSHFPYGTLFVNLTGSFAIGVVMSLLAQINLPLEIQKLVVVGFLGSYTTFSSYTLDVVKLIQNQRYFSGFMYWFGSMLLGWLCLQLGLVLGTISVA